MKDNKLITEFMEVHEIMHDGYSEHDFDDNTLDVVAENELRYHESWDWLMPVVDKIESYTDDKGNAYRFTIDMCNTHIEGTEVEVVGASNKLDAVYQAVVEFINEYNQNK